MVFQDGTGNVGIGTDDPGTYDLKIVSSDLRIALLTGSNYYSTICFGDESDECQATIQFDNQSNDLYFGLGGVQKKAVIDENGLHVHGGIWMQGESGLTRNILYHDGNGMIIRDQSFSTSLFLKDGGNLGIGTISPEYTLDVAGPVNLSKGDTGTALRVNGTEALWYNGTYFSWGYGGTVNYFAKNVGINTNAPAYTLDVAGQAHATSFPTSSDFRFKKEVSQLSNVLDKLERIRGVSFEWNETYESLGRSSGHREIGVIAQDVEAVFPELVTEWGDEGYKAVDYGRMAGVFIEAIKELKVENELLKQRIEDLETILQE
jgi:hypothetical protein